MRWRRRVFWGWLAATVVWLLYQSTRFDLVQMGAIPLDWFLMEALGPPLLLWVLWLVIRWLGRGFFR